MLSTHIKNRATIIDPIKVQFHLAHDCVRACIYVEHIASLNALSNAWVSVHDMCYSEAIISWNQIFGTDSQQAHWKKLSETLPIPPNAKLKPFGMAMIIEGLNITEVQWRKHHQEMVNFRNNRLAHFDFCIQDENPPNLTFALQSACLFREWLLDLLRAYQTEKPVVGISNITGKQILQLFRNEIAEICR